MNSHSQLSAGINNINSPKITPDLMNTTNPKVNQSLVHAEMKEENPELEGSNNHSRESSKQRLNIQDGKVMEMSPNVICAP